MTHFFNNNNIFILYMKILSFNVSWECMTNSESGTAMHLGKICKNLSQNNFQCRDNLIIYLRQIRNNYNEFDILCFQEATNLEVLKKEFNQDFMFYSNQSGNEIMITIINLNKFLVRDIIPGEFKVGRPFCIFILESKLDGKTIILVNLHYCSSHNKDKCNHINFYLTQSLKNKYPNYNVDFSNSRIIVAGDFNYHVNQNLIDENNNILVFKPFQQLSQLKAKKPFESCCYHKKFNDPINYITDLIFDSHYINQINILKPNIQISDHLPIVSFLP